MSKTKRIDRPRRIGAETAVGIIASLHQGGCSVLSGVETRRCLLPPPHRGARISPAPGDRVVFSMRAGGVCTIEEILPRTNHFARVDPRPPHEEHVIAANLDLVVIVIAVKTPPLRPALVDRCLAAAWLGGVGPIVCLNKIDLLAEAERPALAEIEAYAEYGVDLVKCSALTGAGLDRLAALLGGKTAAFIGPSGVGKSSLLNALLPGLGLRTNSVRTSDDKGRHTTTAARLVSAGEQTFIFDTPGFREFGLGELGPRTIARCFPEFAGHTEACQYADCTHVGEPGCAVRLAVRDGLIEDGRYRSYLKILGKSMPDSDPTRHTTFTCAYCGESVVPGGAGTSHRNHCPCCLYSLHLDRRPGDRAACCGGLMEPIAVWVRSGGEWAIIHRCRECGALSSNRIAADDNGMLLMQMAVKPLAMPAFPLDRLVRV